MAGLPTVLARMMPPIAVTYLIPVLLMHSIATSAPPLPVAPAVTADPTGQQVLSRFIRAVGGERAIRNISAMHATGRIILPGEQETGTFSWWVGDGNKCRFNMSFPGLGTSSFGSDGTEGWEIIELAGDTTHQTLDMATVASRRRQANWFELALTLPARATTFETVGPAEFDGHGVWEIKMVDAESRTHHLFFDRTSHLLHGVRMRGAGIGSAADITIRFTQWKPCGPLTLFREVSIAHSDVRLQMLFDTITLDPIPSEFFAVPANQMKPSQKTNSGD